MNVHVAWTPDNWQELAKARQQRLFRPVIVKRPAPAVVRIVEIEVKPRRVRQCYSKPIGPRWHTEMYDDPIGPIQTKRRTPTDFMREMMRDVASKHGVTVADLTGKCRKGPIVKARQEMFWRGHTESYGWSLQSLGRLFGGFDHSTVLHGIARHAERLLPVKSVNVAK